MLHAEEADGIVRVVAGGKLAAPDYDGFVPLFESVAARRLGPVPMLIELAPDFSGWDLGGLWRDLKFDARHKDKFGRVAIVGNKKWEEWGTKLSDPLFSSTEMRFFAPEQLVEAETWVRGERTGRS